MYQSCKGSCDVKQYHGKEKNPHGQIGRYISCRLSNRILHTFQYYVPTCPSLYYMDMLFYHDNPHLTVLYYMDMLFYHDNPHLTVLYYMDMLCYHDNPHLTVLYYMDMLCYHDNPHLTV